MTIVFGDYIGVEFVSSCDISKLEIKMTKSGISTLQKFGIIFYLIIIIPPIFIILVIICYFILRHTSYCQPPSRSKINPNLIEVIQASTQTDDPYSINETQKNCPSSQ